MGLNLGDLYLTVSASTAGLTKGLESGLKSIAGFSRAAKMVARDAAMVGTAFTAVGTVMVTTAAQYDSKVAGSVKRLQLSYAGLAVSVGRSLIPVINELARWVNRVHEAWDGLAPKQRAAIVAFAETTVKVAALIGLGGKLAEFSGNFAKLLVQLLPLLPFLATMTVAIAAIVALIVAWHVVWNDTSNGIQETLKGLWGHIVEGATTAFNYLDKRTEGWGSKFKSAAVSVGDFLTTPLAESIGPDGAAVRAKRLMQTGGTVTDMVNGAITNKDGTRDNMVADTKAQLEKIKNQGVVDYATLSAKLGDAIKAGMDATGLGGLVKSFTSATGNKVKNPKGTLAEVEAAAKAKWDEMDREIQGATDEYIVSLKGMDEVQELNIQRGKDLAKQTKETIEAMASLRSEGIDTLLASMGSAGEAIQKFRAKADEISKIPQLNHAMSSSIGGTGISGANMGGALFALADILMKGKGWVKVMDTLGGLLQMFADVVTAVYAPFASVVGALKGFVDALMVGLKPAFALIAAVIRPFIPILVILGDLFQAMAPIIGVIAGVVLAVTNIGLLPLLLALPIFFQAIKWVAVGLLTVTASIADVWNGLVQGIANFLKAIDVPLIGDMAKMLAKGLEAMKLSSSAELWQQRDNLVKLTMDGAVAQADYNASVLAGADANKSAADAVNDVASAFTNLPTGFRAASAQFMAQSGKTGFAGSMDLLRSSGSTMVVHVHGSIYGEQDWIEKMREAQRQELFQSTGSPVLGGA